MDRDGTDGGREIFERQNNRERVFVYWFSFQMPTIVQAGPG